MPTIEDKDISSLSTRLSKQYGYHSGTIERFIKIFGLSTTKKMLAAYESPPSPSIRTNTLKISTKQLQAKLEVKGFELQTVEWFSDGFVVNKEPYALGGTTEYLLGYYFIQSQASWIPTLLLDPQPGEIVLDMAAAPGGKSTHLAQLMKNTGTLLCIDISRDRMKSLRSNLTRCGVQNAICVRTDARHITKHKIQADKVLLDAPCSGEGLMAVDPLRRNKNGEEDIKRLSLLQKELVATAVSLLKNGGSLVYSTCSTAPEENEEVISWAIENHPLEVAKHRYMQQFQQGFQRTPQKSYNKQLTKAIRLFPHTEGTEGFFVCKLTKREE